MNSAALGLIPSATSPPQGSASPAHEASAAALKAWEGSVSRLCNVDHFMQALAQCKYSISATCGCSCPNAGMHS